jgi:hypothetical protein
VKLAALSWSPEGLGLSMDGVAGDAGPSPPADERFWLALEGRMPGYLFACAGSGPTPLRVWRGSGFDTLEGHPGLPGHVYKAHPAAGLLTALGPEALWVWSGSVWQVRALPRDMTVADVSLDARGGLWAAGASPSTRLPGCTTEAAVRSQGEEGGAWSPRPPRLGLVDSWRAANRGALGGMERIDAERAPVLAFAPCAWYDDESSWFMFVRGATRDRLFVLEGDAPKLVDRTGAAGARVVTTYGRVHHVEERGVADSEDLRPGLRRALGAAGRHLTLRGVDVAGDLVALAVEVAPAGRESCAGPAEWTAVCVSRDAGSTFAVVHASEPGTLDEWCGVAWLRPPGGGRVAPRPPPQA